MPTLVGYTWLRYLAATAWVVAALAAVAIADDSAAADQRAEYERLTAQFVAATPGWRPERPASGAMLFVAPDQYAGAGLTDEQYRAERNRYADELFGLATRAVEAGELSLAFQWATEAVRENPDHADARRVLGYEQRDGQWLTGYGARMFDVGKSWHPQFGWLAADEVPHYEAGERLVGGRWVSGEVDAGRRSEMRRGWQIRTDHFLVTTNHSLEAAAELAARLERLHQVWRQLFAGYYLPEREVRQLFAGERQARRRSRPMRVFYHRDRHEYVAALNQRQPRIADSLGIYFDAQREAHFFAGQDADFGTLYHEAVHQLFQETRSASRNVGRVANFWIVEGVATYFETLVEHVDTDAGLYYTIGQASAGRLPAASERLLADGFYIPLAELTRWGRSDVQHHPEVAKLYSQATGLAALLIDGEGGRYREPLVRYLDAIYAGRDDATTLARETGVEYPQLDAQYRSFLESLAPRESLP